MKERCPLRKLSKKFNHTSTDFQPCCSYSPFIKIYIFLSMYFGMAPVIWYVKRIHGIWGGVPDEELVSAAHRRSGDYVRTGACLASGDCKPSGELAVKHLKSQSFWCVFR